MDNEMKDIVIIGASGFAKEILFLLDRINKQQKIWNILGFVDNNLRRDTQILGIPVVGDDTWLAGQTKPLAAVCAVGSPLLKKKIIRKFTNNPNINFPTVIDPSVIMSSYVSFGQGCIICAGCILTTDIVFGDFITVNLDCTVGHDVRIGDYTTLYPSANISGNVTIGAMSEVGTGAHIIQGITVTNHVIFGAGTVVIKDVNESGTLVGNPARMIKKVN